MCTEKVAIPAWNVLVKLLFGYKSNEVGNGASVGYCLHSSIHQIQTNKHLKERKDAYEMYELLKLMTR